MLQKTKKRIMNFCRLLTLQRLMFFVVNVQFFRVIRLFRKMFGAIVVLCKLTMGRSKCGVKVKGKIRVQIP